MKYQYKYTKQIEWRGVTIQMDYDLDDGMIEDGAEFTVNGGQSIIDMLDAAALDDLYLVAQRQL